MQAKTQRQAGESMKHSETQSVSSCLQEQVDGGEGRGDSLELDGVNVVKVLELVGQAGEVPGRKDLGQTGGMSLQRAGVGILRKVA